MKILVLILSLIVFIKTLSYGIFELKEKNKLGGTCVIIVSIISLVLPNLIVYFSGD